VQRVVLAKKCGRWVGVLSEELVFTTVKSHCGGTWRAKKVRDLGGGGQGKRVTGDAEKKDWHRGNHSTHPNLIPSDEKDRPGPTAKKRGLKHPFTSAKRPNCCRLTPHQNQRISTVVGRTPTVNFQTSSEEMGGGILDLFGGKRIWSRGRGGKLETQTLRTGEWISPTERRRTRKKVASLQGVEMKRRF